MNYYNEIAASYNELHGEEQKRKLGIIRDNLDVSKKSKLLDVGCGTGLSKDIFDCEWIGIDPAEKLLEFCSGKTICCPGEDLPFEDNSFDIVICVSALHNFTDFEKGLSEMKRVGKDKFVITVLKKSSNADLLKELIAKNFTIEKEVDDFHDVIYFGKV